MSQPSGKSVYIPPYSRVRLVECREHFQIVPVPDVKIMHGYGKVKSKAAKIDVDDPKSEPIWDDLDPEQEVWCVMQWYEFADGHQIPRDMIFSRPDSSEKHVKKLMQQLEDSSKVTREELLRLTQCYRATEEDYQYIEDNHPNYQTEPDPKNADEYDVYHARLKVMAELSPKTVELMKIVGATRDPEKRQFVEREAVQSYFAEIAHYLTEDEILGWQQTNPVGTGWMCEFGEVMKNPRRQLDPVNHELALNWLRRRYNEMTASELRDSIFDKVWRWLAPGLKMTADFIKKRRENLGLTTKRPPGPRPKSERQ